MDDRPQREMSLMEYVEIANLPKSHRIWREFNELQRQAEEIKELRNQNTNQAMLITEINDKMLLQAIKNGELRAEIERLKAENQRLSDKVARLRDVVDVIKGHRELGRPHWHDCLCAYCNDIRQSLDAFDALNEGKGSTDE